MLKRETFEEAQKLKEEYERLRDHFLTTQKPVHYLQFEEAFRTYKCFVEQHKISGHRLSEELEVSKSPEDKTPPPYQKVKIFVPYQRPCLTHPKNIKAQKEIMAFMEMQTDFKSIKQIVPHLSLQTSQVRRHLYSLSEQGLLDFREINGLQYWRKK